MEGKKMKIGLIDVDSHNFPNLPLMKISAWHKAQGDEVEIANNFLKYDRVYQAKVFTFSPDENTYINAKEIIKGGTGYDIKNLLPAEIEKAFPDYSLYPNHEGSAYGFMTRGCPNNCGFCIVTPKEGRKSYRVAEVKDFWNGQKEIKILDANLTASPDALEIIRELKGTKAWIDFTQGLDIRLMTEEMAHEIQQLKLKMMHFAWDGEKQEKTIKAQLKKYRKYWTHDDRRLRVYVLVNYGTTHEYDLERIYKIKEMGYDPFVMIYEKATADKRTRQLARWCNNKYIFRACAEFKDYWKKGAKK